MTLLPAPGLATEVLDGEAVVLRLSDRVAHRLDTVGTAVWLRLAEAPRLDQLVADLADHYDAPPARVERDVTALLERLEDSGLLVDR